MHRLRTLGTLELRDSRGARIESILAQPKRAALLVYLALASDGARRDTLTALFWPDLDQARARHALRQALHVLRVALGDDALTASGDEVRLNAESVWCDAVAFDRAIEGGRLEEALELYRGDFLEGFHVGRASAEFEFWLEGEQARLQERAAQAAEALARRAGEVGETKQAVGWLERALEVDPLDEEALRELLSHLERLGERGRALRAYDGFARRLGGLYETEPDEETREIAARLRAGVEEAWPGGLPRPEAPLIGRERELEALRSLLVADERRLVTLTGPAGTGKTRLAIEAAADLASAFEGVRFVPLAVIRDPTLVPSAIARALEIREVPDRPVLDLVVESLAGRRLLLLLDNFEQVLAAARVVEQIAETAPGVRVLVTSRSPLRVVGERRFSVPRLDLPEAERVGRPETLVRFSAVRLFVDRACAARPRFRLTSDNADAIARVCRAIDGLPLAIELAAARIRLLDPQAMLERIEHRLALLKGGGPDRPARHRSLRAAIEWSHELLDDREREIFRRLAVFAGGFTLESAEAVCRPEGDPAMEVLDALSALVDASLVQEIGPKDASRRFGLLETIREYAAERLAESGEADAVARLHAEHFAAFAERAKKAQWTAEQSVWAIRLDAESGNVRRALDWALAAREAELAARVADAIWLFWVLKGWSTEGRRWIAPLLDLCAERLSKVHAMAVDAAAGFALAGGDETQAIELWETSIPMWRRMGEEITLAAALNNLGMTLWRRNDLDRASAALEESLSLHRKLGKTRAAANSLCNLGAVAQARGDPAAIEMYRASQKEFRAAGDEYGAATALHNVGYWEMQRGDLEESGRSLKEALRVFASLDYRSEVIMSCGALAEHARRTGNLERSACLIGVIEGLGSRTGYTLPALYRSHLDLERDESLRALGEERFQEVYRAGAALDFDEAVAFALEPVHSSPDSNRGSPTGRRAKEGRSPRAGGGPSAGRAT